MIGQRFGRWTVIKEDGFALVGKKRVRKKEMLWCICDCGSERSVTKENLKNGTSNSCGCLKLELIHKNNYLHGRNTSDPTYATWSALKDRCKNPKAQNYKNYGGRGIRVCKEWESFENFLRDMGEKPNGMSIDRIDVNGNYEAGNCRWATCREQARNQRNKVLYEAFGKRQLLVDWASESGLSLATIFKRIKRGWAVEKAVSFGAKTPQQMAEQRRQLAKAA